MHDVVVVEISDELATGMGERDIARRAWPCAFGAEHAEPLVADAGEQGGSVVHTAVIDDEQLPVRICLAIDGGDGARQEGAAVASRQHDRDEWRGADRGVLDPVHDCSDLQVSMVFVDQLL